MSNREITLIWKGVWEVSKGKVPYDITDQPGLYMVLTGKRETLLRRWKILDQLIYIGHAANIRKGLRDEGMWDEWEKHNQHNLLVKLATYEEGEELEELAYCLAKNTGPICNTILEQDGNQPPEGLLIIKNKGQKWPITDTYQCNLPIPNPKQEEPDSESEQESAEESEQKDGSQA